MNAPQTPMKVNQLGSSGIAVSALGLGLAALGRPGYINLGHGEDLEGRRDPDALQRHAHAVLDAAWDAGMRYFDAARSYGRAEDFLASWLERRDIGRKEVTIGSKWGYTYTAGWQVDAEVHEVKEHSAAALERQLTESRSRLGAYLDLYQIHSATTESGVLERPEVLHRLAELRDQGVLVGLTTSGPRQFDTIERALEVERGSDRVFDTVQSTWNLLEPSAGVALAAAHQAGVGVIVKEALANGRLTRRSPRDVTALTKISEEVPADALALAAVVAQPWCDVVLSGASTVAQLESNLAALAVERDTLTRLPDVAEVPEAYWSYRGSLPWN